MWPPITWRKSPSRCCRKVVLHRALLHTCSYETNLSAAIRQSHPHHCSIVVTVIRFHHFYRRRLCRSASVGRSVSSVCLTVCLSAALTQKRMIPKCSNSVYFMILRLPILHHYVWSEITGHNSLQRHYASGKIVALAHHDTLAPAKNYLYIPYNNLYSGVFVIYCHCQIQLLSKTSRRVS